MMLIMSADHDYNASAFAARVTTSTNSDLYSAHTSAIGTLKGRLHGGACEAAMMFMAEFKNEDQAEAKLREMLSQK